MQPFWGLATLYPFQICTVIAFLLSKVGALQESKQECQGYDLSERFEKTAFSLGV